MKKIFKILIILIVLLAVALYAYRLTSLRKMALEFVSEIDYKTYNGNVIDDE